MRHTITFTAHDDDLLYRQVGAEAFVRRMLEIARSTRVPLVQYGYSHEQLLHRLRNETGYYGRFASVRRK